MPRRRAGSVFGADLGIAQHECEEFVDRPALDDEAAIHEELAKAQFGIEDRGTFGAAIHEADADLVASAVAKGMHAAAGGHDRQRAAPYEPRKNRRQYHFHDMTTGKHSKRTAGPAARASSLARHEIRHRVLEETKREPQGSRCVDRHTAGSALRAPSGLPTPRNTGAAGDHVAGVVGLVARPARTDRAIRGPPVSAGWRGRSDNDVVDETGGDGTDTRCSRRLPSASPIPCMPSAPSRTLPCWGVLRSTAGWQRPRPLCGRQCR